VVAQLHTFFARRGLMPAGMVASQAAV